MQTATSARLASYQKRVEAALQSRLSQGQSQLQQAIGYSALGGGKRIRASLVYAAGELGTGASESDLDVLACLVEMVHTYSLIHDDLPAMDNADTRRGRASCHRVFGEAQAILAGDALQAMAFGLLVELQDQSKLVEILCVLRDALGVKGMVAGQALELESASAACDEALLKRIHWMKTGALIQASLLLGAMISNCSQKQLQTLTSTGECLGLAFQVVDDLLDYADGDEEFNYVSVLGREQTLERSESLHAQALKQLQSLPNPEAVCDLVELMRSRWSWE